MSQSPLDRLPPPPLRVVFMGTPDFAVKIFESLLDGPDRIVGVFTRPDAAVGRGLKLESPPVKRIAGKHGVPVVQPKRWKDGAALSELVGFSPDLVVVAAYGRLLPQAALDAPRYGCINVHASLLPRWRGADPITRAILAGDRETGVTIMQMVLEMDAGAMLWQRRTAISAGDTSGSLEARLAELGGVALGEALQAWRAGSLMATAQDESLVTLAPPVRKSDGEIDWTASADEIERATRAFAPWPGAFTWRGDTQLKIWRAEVIESGAGVTPGAISSVAPEGIVIATGRGSLRVLEVQGPGKRRMSAAEFARGARLATGELLGKRAS